MKVKCSCCLLYCGESQIAVPEFMCPACLAMRAKIRHLFDMKYPHEEYMQEIADNIMYAKRGLNAFWDAYYGAFEAQMSELEGIWCNGDANEREV